MDAWQSILLAFGGNAVLLVVLGWLARSFGTQLLAKDLEKFKADLSAASSQATERLKHELQMAAKEHEVRFSKLHERRAEVVAEIYGLLVESVWAAQDLLSRIKWLGEKPNDVKYREARGRVLAFFQYFEKHRIYLPQGLCDQLEQFVRTVSDKILTFSGFINLDQFQPGQRPLEEPTKEEQDDLANAVRFMEKEAPKAKAALEDELRRLLGA